MKKEPTLRPHERILHIHAECINFVGFKRGKNEDCFCANEYFISQNDMGNSITCSQEMNGNKALYGVFDGVGGDPQGELASCAAARFFSDNRADILKACMDKEQLTESFKKANDVVRMMGNGSGTTAVLLMITDAKVYIANVGDSSAYLFRNGRLTILSASHRPMANGIAAPSHAITRYLGEDSNAKRYLPSVCAPVILEHDDLFVLCSDGLTDMLSDTRIEAVLCAGMDDKEAANTLVNYAMEAGGKDNTTVVLVRVRVE